MSFLIAIGRIALQALSRNRMRSLLTMLGVTIGVAAVIAMVAVGNGAKASVQRTLRSAGTSIVQVSAGNFIKGGESMNIATGAGSATTLSREDAVAIRQLDDVVHVAAGLRSRTWVEAAPDQRLFTLVLGTEAEMGDIHGWTWLSGQGFANDDVAASKAVAVLGRIASASIFGQGVDPVGRRVTIHGTPFEIVGVMRAVDRDQDEGVFVPVTILQTLTSRNYLQTITIGVTEAGVATKVGDEITRLLRQRHKPVQAPTTGVVVPNSSLGGVPAGQGRRTSTADDFIVRTLAAQQVTKGLYTEVAAFALANMSKLDSATMEEMSGTLNRAGTTMTALLGSIAGVSLVVGGIGIMTIMLVSVTERTKEIGLRLAVGARRREVLLQFLVEALALSLLGGIAGVAAGILGARGLTSLLEWPTEISVSTVALAFGIAAIVGIGFGYYPARRASQLDPIDALRHE
jgi:putative ABC transport system permease protein